MAIIAIAIPRNPARAQQHSNPFAYLDALEQQVGTHDPDQVRWLMQMAEFYQLHGTARRYARQLVRLEPNDKRARDLLYQWEYADPETNAPVWLDWFDSVMWNTHGKVRDPVLGYCLLDDRRHLQRGHLRDHNNQLIFVDRWDREHATWSNPTEIYTRFFHIKATLPLAATWWVADDLDRLAVAYLDFFEVERLPARRSTVHLYGSQADATAAGADLTLLTRYGAYYLPGTRVLHVLFKAPWSMTVVRHEAAHALNRQYIGDALPQWFDEGIGALCQLAVPTNDDRGFVFGRFPDSGFANRHLDEVRAGWRERMAVIHSTPTVVTSTHYYSKFRTMIDFFMNAHDRKYRWTFIDAMFRRRGEPAQLVALPDIDHEWMSYVAALEPDPQWTWRPLPAERTDEIERVLASGTSAVLFPNAVRTITSSYSFSAHATE